MNEVIKTLTERRSIRKFKAEMPKKEDLEQIIQAGLYAPSARGLQPTMVVAVTDKETRDRLSAVNAEIWGREGVD
ncbi:MAG: nitroreductase family protein, partial [Lachnospiraceae bacterium]|nr:nitroreductase family protein [Lachnospiraceae bacterium]